MPDVIEGASYRDTVFNLEFTVEDVYTDDETPLVDIEYEDGKEVTVKMDVFRNSTGLEIDEDSH